jgi:hypothetical protein
LASEAEPAGASVEAASRTRTGTKTGLRFDSATRELIDRLQPALAFRNGYFGGGNRSQVIRVALAFASEHADALAEFATHVELNGEPAMNVDLGPARERLKPAEIADAVASALAYYARGGIPSVESIANRPREFVYAPRSELTPLALAAFAARRAVRVEVVAQGEARMRAWLRAFGAERALREDLVDIEARYDPVLLADFQRQASVRRLDWWTLLWAPTRPAGGGA